MKLSLNITEVEKIGNIESFHVIKKQKQGLINVQSVKGWKFEYCNCTLSLVIG